MNQKQVEAQPVLVQKKHGGNRGLIGLLCALGVIIAGLVVAIVVVKVNENKSIVGVETYLEGYGESLTPSVVALNFYEEVQNKFENDESYSYDDAIRDFERALLDEKGEIRANIGLRYASFVKEYTADALRGIQILEKVESDMSDVPTKRDFYTLMIQYHTELESSGEIIESYKVKLNDLADKKEYMIGEDGNAVIEEEQ